MNGNRLIIYIACFVFFCTSCVDETKVQGVIISPTQLQLSVGDTYQLEMIIKPLSASIYALKAWSSSDESVATVDENGVVTAVYAGECIIKGQAMYHSEYCTVKVVSPKYALTFSDAAIFDYGDTDGAGVNNITLRLHNEDITIDSTGAVMGNGLFLNLSLYTSISDEYIVSGRYTVSDNLVQNTIQKGEIYSVDGVSYARGSYLGQYGDYGLSTIFIESGYMTIDKYGQINNITCVFGGGGNEHISVSYAAEPKYYLIRETEHYTLNYIDYNLEQFYVYDENLLSHRRLEFETEQGYRLELYLRTPISSQELLPQGSYSISNDVRPFTLMDSESEYPCIIVDSGYVKKIKSGSLNVMFRDSDGTLSFSGTFVDEDGNQYTIK